MNIILEFNVKMFKLTKIPGHTAYYVGAKIIVFFVILKCYGYFRINYYLTIFMEYTI